MALFEPGQPTDGVTVEIPLAVLNQVVEARFDWQVPGYRRELVTALIRSLPKALRRQLSPAADHADAFLERAEPGRGPLAACLARELALMSGDPVALEALSVERIPDHLRITFKVVDDTGRTVRSGKDLDRLRRDLREHTRAAVSAAAGAIERTGLRAWTFGNLPRTVEVERGRYRVRGYPGLVDEDRDVSIHVFDDVVERDAEMWRGTRRLILIALPLPAKAIQRSLSNEAKLALGRSRQASVAEVLADCSHAAVDRLIVEAGGPAWDEDGFSVLREFVRAHLADTAVAVVTFVGRIVTTADRLQRRLDAVAAPALHEAVIDMQAQLDALVYPGFAAVTGAGRLPDVLRYLRGIDARLDKLAENPARDRDRTRAVRELTERYERVRPVIPAGDEEIRWMIEELRISLFAQALGTSRPVSATRILRAIDGVGRATEQRYRAATARPLDTETAVASKQ